MSVSTKSLWQEVTSKVRRKHCEKAMAEIDISGVPEGRESKDYYIWYKIPSGIFKAYPPKYVIELAFKIAMQEKGLPSQLIYLDFSGGSQANKFLKDKGFDIFSTKKK